MKKLFFLLASILLWASCSNQDEPVNQAPEAAESQTASRYLSPSEAVKRASEAYENMFGKGSRSTLSGRAYLYNASTGSRSFGTDSVLYVVNFDEGGFAVVPAYRYDDTEAYAIGEHSSIGLTPNPAAEAYMDMLYDRAFNLRDSIDLTQKFDSTLFGPGLPPGWQKGTPPYSDYWFHTYRSDSIYAKTVFTKWGQDYPYNKFCPVWGYDSNGQPIHTLAGCVAVAIGQICGYHRIPANSIDGYRLDWSKMLAKPKIYGLEEKYQDQIAHLLRQIGIRASLTYGDPSNEGTGGYVSNYYPAIVELGFSKAKHITNLSTCIDYVKTTGPCIIRGSGHCWVIDGIREVINDRYRALPSDLENEIPYTLNRKYYIQCNWGWEGEWDGLYLAQTVQYSDCALTASGKNEWKITDEFFKAGSIGTDASKLTFIINFK